MFWIKIGKQKENNWWDGIRIHEDQATQDKWKSSYHHCHWRGKERMNNKNYCSLVSYERINIQKQKIFVIIWRSYS